MASPSAKCNYNTPHRELIKAHCVWLSVEFVLTLVMKLIVCVQIEGCLAIAWSYLSLALQS